jgi:hypothetical protein
VECEIERNGKKWKFLLDKKRRIKALRYEGMKEER